MDGSADPPEAVDGVVVNRSCTLDASEIDWRFGPSGGPGGQHANRSNTRAEARFDVERSASLSEAQRRRVSDKLGPVVTVIVDETRSQTRNRAIAVDRLAQRLADALVVPRPRRPTKPSRAAKARRVDTKRRRGETKRGRSRSHRPDEG